MTIGREELKGMDFRDESTGQRLAAVHPGDVLLHDFIEPMGLTRYKVAKLALCLPYVCAAIRLFVTRPAILDDGPAV